MWAFYGQSTTYPIIIGIFKFISVILLFHQKTRILGCLIGMVILFNIIIQDIIYQIPIAAINVATLLQCLLSIILLINKNRIIQLLKELFKSE